MSHCITVMSFNMKRNYLSFGKNSWEKRAALVARVIRENQPDLLGTQELTNASLGDLQRLLPEYGCIGQGRGGGDQGEYSAIFYRKSRFTLLEEETFWLSKMPSVPSRAWLALFPRICTCCRLALRESPSVSLQFYNTHLDHVSYLARFEGLKLIISHILQSHQLVGYAPVILTGDFNATPNSRTLRRWQEHMTANSELATMQNLYHLLVSSPQGSGRSYHGFRGAVRGNPIDYIFSTRDFTLLDSQIYRESFDSRFPSDHYPVVAQLELHQSI